MKKIISAILCITMLCSMCSVFADEKTDNFLALPRALALQKLNLLNGTEEGFELTRYVTRAEAITMIMRMYPEHIGALGMPKPIFSDIDGHWAYKEIITAKMLGLVDGTTETTFEPSRNVTADNFQRWFYPHLVMKI